MTKTRHPQTDPTRISFRLDPETAAELARRARDAGKSQGLYARELVLEAVFHGEEQQHQLMMIQAELARLAAAFETLRPLRTDLASSVAILLAHAGKLEPEQATQWVRQTLFPKKPKE